ncbi:hypothetical protein, partial [Bordetella pertussis]|uniref:hypothetical protein n=1 Tax=Bordetella pertussis TaxID=520 RepID=UPI000A575A83
TPPWRASARWRSWTARCRPCGRARAGSPQPSAPRETREALLARFRQRAGAALLASYGNAIDPVLALPPERAQALTCLYLLEKAAYEICYESAYRPERLPVPIHGLAETARAALLAAAVDHDEGPAP